MRTLWNYSTHCDELHSTPYAGESEATPWAANPALGVPAALQDAQPGSWQGF